MNVVDAELIISLCVKMRRIASHFDDDTQRQGHSESQFWETDAAVDDKWSFSIG